MIPRTQDQTEHPGIKKKTLQMLSTLRYRLRPALASHRHIFLRPASIAQLRLQSPPRLFPKQLQHERSRNYSVTMREAPSSEEGNDLIFVRSLNL